MKKIVRVMCMIQQDTLEKREVKQLQSMMSRLYQQHFGDGSRLVCVWLTIPEGQAYIAGKPSTASTVQIPVDDNLQDKNRHKFMGDVCSQWRNITSCNKNEIILTCPDKTNAKAHFSAVTERIKISQRSRTQIKLILKMLINYFKKGYLNTSINF